MCKKARTIFLRLQLSQLSGPPLSSRISLIQENSLIKPWHLTIISWFSLAHASLTLRNILEDHLHSSLKTFMGERPREFLPNLYRPRSSRASEQVPEKYVGIDVWWLSHQSCQTTMRARDNCFFEEEWLPCFLYWSVHASLVGHGIRISEANPWPSTVVSEKVEAEK